MKVEKEDEAEKTAALLNKTLLKPVRVLKCTVEETVLFNTSNQ
jgi:hypothetical protein